MHQYRCFLLDACGTIRGAELIGAENDAEAWHQAIELLGRRPHFRAVEVWEQRQGVEAAGRGALDRDRSAERIIRKLRRPDVSGLRRAAG
jgi:hypothetical protein